MGNSSWYEIYGLRNLGYQVPASISVCLQNMKNAKIDMYNILKIALVALLGILFVPAFAQDPAANKLDRQIVNDLSKTPKMAFGVSAERPLKGAFVVYDNLKLNDAKIEKFEIVIWGPIVTDLKKGSELSAFIKPFLDGKLDVSVCKVALDKMGIREAELMPGIKVVDNAYVRLFQLQALDYNVLIP